MCVAENIQMFLDMCSLVAWLTHSMGVGPPDSISLHGQNLSLVHKYAVTQTVQIRGIITTEKYSRFTPQQKNI